MHNQLSKQLGGQNADGVYKNKNEKINDNKLYCYYGKKFRKHLRNLVITYNQTNSSVWTR